MSVAMIMIAFHLTRRPAVSHNFSLPIASPIPSSCLIFLNISINVSLFLVSIELSVSKHTQESNYFLSFLILALPGFDRAAYDQDFKNHVSINKTAKLAFLLFSFASNRGPFIVCRTLQFLHHKYDRPSCHCFSFSPPMRPDTISKKIHFTCKRLDVIK